MKKFLVPLMIFTVLFNAVAGGGGQLIMPENILRNDGEYGYF
jgi:hypothetical protein